MELINFEEECYICMDNIQSELIKLNCCYNELIHKKCLVMLYINNISKCPLCNSQYNICNYITKKEVKHIFKELDVIEKILYNEQFKQLLSEYDTFIDFLIGNRCTLLILIMLCIITGILIFLIIKFNINFVKY